MESQYNYQSNQPFQTALPNANAVLVLGILSIIGCLCYGFAGTICAIIALVLAKNDLKLYRANPAAYTHNSYSNLNNGRVCAIIGLSISIIYLLFIIFIIFTAGFGILRHPDQFLHSNVI